MLETTFQNAMKACGLLSAFVFVGYLVAEIIARSDGDAGFELAGGMARILIAASLAGAVLSGGALIAERGHRVSAERDIRPIVHAELETVARDVGEALANALEQRLNRTMAQGNAKTVAALKECITGELLREQLDRAVGRARVYGQVTEARMRAAHDGLPINGQHASVSTLRRDGR